MRGLSTLLQVLGKISDRKAGGTWIEKPLVCLDKAHSSCRVTGKDWKPVEQGTLGIYNFYYQQLGRTEHMCFSQFHAEASLKWQEGNENFFFFFFLCRRTKRADVESKRQQWVGTASRLIPVWSWKCKWAADTVRSEGAKSTEKQKWRSTHPYFKILARPQNCEYLLLLPIV